MRVPSQPLPLGPADGRLTAREWLVLALAALVLTVCVCLVEPNIFGSKDWVRMHSLYKAYIQLSVAQGRLPLWNPHHWLGRPFLADIETAFFYPPELLYLFLDIHIACALTCALHYFLLLYGTVKLARALGANRLVSLFVAFVFAASAPIVGCFTSGLLHYGQALCFAPLVFYLGLRLQAGPRASTFALLALALGLQLLCGHPQAAWLTEVGLAVFLCGRRLGRPWLPSCARLGVELGLCGVALALGLALAGIALLPFAELATQGNRPTPSLAFASLFAEPCEGWATLFVPTQLPYFRMQANAQLYAGLVPLVAGLCGLACLRDRNVRALLALAGFAALLAAGEQTPAFRIFFHAIPGVGWLRIHSRATVLVTLAVVLAAGCFLSRAHARREAMLTGAVALLVLLGSVVFCLAWPGYGAAAPTLAIERGLAALLAGALLLAWMRAGAGRRASARRAVDVLLVTLTAADLAIAVGALKHDNRESPFATFERQLQGTLAAEGLVADGQPPPRVFAPSLRENAGMTRGWSSPYGYSALAPGRVWRYMHSALGLAIPSRANTFPAGELAAFGPMPYNSMSLVMGEDPHTGYFYRNPAPDPRAYLATSARRVRDDVEATALMRGGHDFRATPLVEQALELPTQPVVVAGSAVITQFAPERITVAVESAVPGVLVLAEPWFPGWAARVNGEVAPCIPANAWMRAVPVPAGQTQVVLGFRSTYLPWGAALTLGALAVLALLWRETGRRRARSS